MASVQDFSAVEWTILTELPIRVVASAITVDPSSELGSILEQVAGLTQLSHGAENRLQCELVSSVFAAYKQDEEGEAHSMQLSDQWLEDLIPQTLLRATQVTEILSRHDVSDDGLQYKEWLLETAEAVCEAAISGGFLGIGGRRISQPETKFLDDLRKAFGLDRKPGS